MLVLPGAGKASEDLALDEVLARAGRYVSEYQVRLASVIAEERYEQVAYGERGGHRNLVSDLLLVRLPSYGWVSFRDVMEVDGHPVTDRDERARKLFLDAAQRGDVPIKIQEESSRFNIGPERNINVPLLPLVFLQQPYRSRFRFSKAGTTVVDGIGVWEVRFVEQARPTVVRDSNPPRKDEADEPSEGEFWIDPSSGRILRTHHEVTSQKDRWSARLTVRYRPDATLDLLVPAEMEESFGPRGAALLSRRTFLGRAKYSHYRQAQVEVGPITYK